MCNWTPHTATLEHCTFEANSQESAFPSSPQMIGWNKQPLTLFLLHSHLPVDKHSKIPSVTTHDWFQLLADFVAGNSHQLEQTVSVSLCA